MSAVPPRTDVVRGVFPTWVGEFWFPDFAAEKPRLLAALEAVRGADHEGEERSRQVYNCGYTSYYTRRFMQDDPPFARLTAFIRERAARYALQQKWDVQRFELVMTSLWVNVNPRGSFHEDHVHPYSHISGVFYVRCAPGSGELVLRDPRPARCMAPPPVVAQSMENTDEIKVEPVEGKLMMFPSWLTHGVKSNPVADDRVSMSYNFELKPRRGAGGG